MRGWPAAVAKERNPRRQVRPYRELAELFDFFRPFHFAPFDEAAADLLGGFSAIQIGAMDRKIAAIARAGRPPAHGQPAGLRKNPGLRFANWMDA